MYNISYFSNFCVSFVMCNYFFFCITIIVKMLTTINDNSVDKFKKKSTDAGDE